jgi:hypothetical protein
MVQQHSSYGSILKQAIMDDNVEFIDNMVAPIDIELYNQAYDICNNCDLNALKQLINQGVDLSHPYFCQPECFILNPLTSTQHNFITITTFVNYLIKNCIDVNAIGLEAYHCMYSTQNRFTFHNQDIIVPTLLDIVEDDESINHFAKGCIIELLRSNGAKSGVELGYTREHGDRLNEFDFNTMKYNYEYMKTKKAELHFELFANLFSPNRIEEYLKTNDEIRNYLV